MLNIDLSKRKKCAIRANMGNCPDDFTIKKHIKSGYITHHPPHPGGKLAVPQPFPEADCARQYQN